MKITTVESWVIKMKKGEVYLGSPESGARRLGGDYFIRPGWPIFFSVNTESYLVKIETDTGIVGWGEAQAPLVPEAVREIVDNLLGPVLMGRDPLDIDPLWEEMYRGMRTRGHVTSFMLDAMAACNIALWDILGKKTGLPIYVLLGGAHQRRLPAYVSGIARSELDQRIPEWIERGFTAFKLKLGYTVDEDIEVVRRVREQHGSDIDLMLDVHWNFTPSEAIELGRELQKYRVSFVEAPVATEDEAGLTEVTRTLDLPIAAGEEYRTRHEFRSRLANRAMDIVQPDVGRTGITEFMKIAGMSQAFNLKCAPHLGVGLGVYIAASMHVGAALSNFYTIEFQPVMMALANEMLETPIDCTNGAYVVPEAPGLGVGVNERKLSEWRVD